MTRLFLRLFFDHAMLGPGKIELLERIRDGGSIASAGRAMGMSYKRAWSLVEEMNAAFAEPLVVSARGGAGGGGARLSDTGAAVVQHFHAFVATAETCGAAHLAALEALLRPGADMSGGK